MIGHAQELVVGFIAGFGWGGLFGILTGLFVGVGILEKFAEPPPGDPPKGSAP